MIDNELRLCSIEGCDKKHDARGYCKTHGSRFYRNGDALLNMRRDPTYTFNNSFVPVPESGCWIWEGTTRRGYGRIIIKKKHWIAHRYSWALHRGPIPKGMLVLHKCDTPLCVNPEHLYLGTHKDNIRDMHKRGRWKYKRPLQIMPKCPVTGKFTSKHNKTWNGKEWE